MGLPQQNYDGQDADGENQQGRISAAGLIPIEPAGRRGYSQPGLEGLNPDLPEPE